ncbi:MAG: hypothetical protein E6Q24_04905 [Chitinophagaceae bacterium]|nr:MAG: hypothetical protein E6Q24_04905 [Chitinophagaceae bacterium]
MKKIHLLLLVMSILGIEHVSAQSSIQTVLAERIAGRLKDSLSLSLVQKDSIYAVNMLISNQKNSLRSIYQNLDSLQFHTQRVEHSRDSLYRRILGEEKYLLYRQKKNNLVNNN